MTEVLGPRRTGKSLVVRFEERVALLIMHMRSLYKNAMNPAPSSNAKNVS